MCSQCLQKTIAKHMARGQMPWYCECFTWVSAEALPERCEGGAPKRRSFLSCLPCRCCHGAKQRWETSLWPPQIPADGEMDDILREQTKGGKQGPTKSCQQSGPRHAPLLQEPSSKLMLPAAPCPFSAACQPHVPGMGAQRWVNHLHSGFLSLCGTKPAPITPG